MNLKQKLKGLFSSEATDYAREFMYQNFTHDKAMNQFDKFKPYSQANQQVANIIKPLIRDGIVFIEDFYTSEEVDAIAKELIPEIDKLDEFMVKTSVNQQQWIDDARTKMVQKEYGYTRVGKIENYGVNSKKHVENEFFRQVASEYYGRECKQYQSIIQKSVYAENNVGLDWHYDNNAPRFKAFLYLHDVDLNHGPFSLYKGTQHISHFKLKKMYQMKSEDYNYGSIVQPDEINRYIEPYYERVDAVAKKGTLAFADVNAIHRGLMTQPGFERYAVVVYFSPDK